MLAQPAFLAWERAHVTHELQSNGAPEFLYVPVIILSLKSSFFFLFMILLIAY